MNPADRSVELCIHTPSKATHPLRPGGALSARPHICAFFNGPDDEYRALLPFIKDGFECGDKIVHTVDPARRVKHLQRLTDAGIDVTATRLNGQFDLYDWTDTHLRDGRFEVDKTLAFFSASAKKANAQGFPLIHFVTHMEWALEGTPGTTDLLEYEARANDRWLHGEGPVNPVICVYDLTKFSAQVLVDVIRTHPVIIVGGILQENPFFESPAQYLHERRERQRPQKVRGGAEEDARGLKACLNDLISVLSIPSIWSGGEPRQVISALLDVLVGMLYLDFGYASLQEVPGGPSVELIRPIPAGACPIRTEDVGEKLRSLRSDSPQIVKNPFGDGNVTIAPLRLGLHDEVGWLALASRRADFPTKNERVLMSVAANQAAIGLQEARLRGEQKRVAEDLDRKVAQRTKELAAANEDLKLAFREIRDLKDQLQRENVVLREEVDAASMFEEIVGTAPALRGVLSRVSKVAPADTTVLITGETGTGKELIARAIHKRSGRSKRAFVSVNCAAIPPTLIASELFGHEKGAFTGAMHRRLGRFELAQGGTLFLDECGDLPMEIQITLLRVLQEREFERVGGTQPVKADVRLIAATNRNLQSAIASGSFRSDLYYRLNVFPIDMPSLRMRREDIPILTEYFIHRYSAKLGKRVSTISKDTLDRFQSYAWPGNIRELQNVIERSLIVCETDAFSVDESWLAVEPDRLRAPDESLTTILAIDERTRIEAALSETNGRISGPSGAAVKLVLPPSTLESKIRALKINKNRFRS
jgi:transcriptional regulator with GAF, ATPase, and Fis domain